MSVYPTDNFKISILINNFKTQDTELNFGDFRIVKPGSNAVEWRKKLKSRRLPEHILIKEVLNWKAGEDEWDMEYKIINSICTDLQLAFRLFKVGDIMFGDFLIENINKNESSSNMYNRDISSPPQYKYKFGQDEIPEFNKFRNDIANKVGYGNKFYKLAQDYFMSGVDKGYSKIKIVDYIIALESLFLIDNKKYFLMRMLSERISNFLKDDDVKKIVKYMYDERSNIVHGNNIDLSEDKQLKKDKKISEYMPGFEDLMRKVFRKLFDFNFSKKEDMVKFMEGLYDVPRGSLEIMKRAQKEADKYFCNHSECNGKSRGKNDNPSLFESVKIRIVG